MGSPTPPFYEATQDIFVHNPESGTMAVAAFRAGDKVPGDLVLLNGWGGQVKVPDVFAEEFGPRPDKKPAKQEPAPEDEPAPKQRAAKTTGEEK